jgi:hypothetical protein
MQVANKEEELNIYCDPVKKHGSNCLPCQLVGLLPIPELENFRIFLKLNKN